MFAQKDAMRFHLVMLLVVIFVALSMHAMASAAVVPQCVLAPVSSPGFGAR